MGEGRHDTNGGLNMLPGNGRETPEMPITLSSFLTGERRTDFARARRINATFSKERYEKRDLQCKSVSTLSDTARNRL